jgi:hypothetical protein
VAGTGGVFSRFVVLPTTVAEGNPNYPRQHG